MKHLFIILLTVLSSLNFSFGQNKVRARFIRQDIFGKVYFKTPVLNYLSDLEELFHENGRLLKIDVKEFEVREHVDSTGIDYTKYMNGSSFFVPVIFYIRDFWDLYFPEIADNVDMKGRKTLQIHDHSDEWTARFNSKGRVNSIKKRTTSHSSMREDLSNFSDTWEEMDQRGDDWSFTYQNGKIRKLTQRQYAWAKGKNRQEISTPFQIEFQYNSGGLSSEISYLEEQTPVSPYLCVDSLISFYNLGWNRNWDHDNYYHIFTAFEKLRLQEVMFCIYKSSSLSEILFWCEKQGHEIVRLMIDCDDTGKITTVTDYWERTIYEYDPKMNRLAKRIHRSKSFSSPNYLENDEKSMEIARDFSESYYYDSLGRIIKTSGQNIYSSRPNIRLEKSYARTGKIVDYKIKEH